MDFFHWGTKKKHYKRAAQYLQTEMDTDVYAIQAVDGSTMVMTDQEKALCSGLNEGFHSPTGGPPKYLLCLIHMERNLNDYLIKRTDQLTTNKIKTSVFGKSGIVKTSTGKGEFYDKFEQFRETYGQHFEEQRLDTLIEKLWEFAVEPAILYPHIKVDQSTNRMESQNARLRRLTNHRDLPLDKMVMKCENQQEAHVSFLNISLGDICFILSGVTLFFHIENSNVCLTSQKRGSNNPCG